MPSPAEDQWLALIERIEGLAAVLRLSPPGNEGGAAATGRFLMAQATRALDDLKNLTVTSRNSVSPGLIDAADRAIKEWKWWSPDSDQSYARTHITQLAVLAGELRYRLRDPEAGWASLVERAFLHLNRALVVDGDTRSKWKAAFNVREEECERLGGVHLLSHGIWAFKANSPGERTDLILGEPIRTPSTRDRRAVVALTHTEWKLARSSKDVPAKFDEAMRQAKVYGRGSLAGFELASVCYIVTVGLDYAADLDDVPDGGVVYRHVHIAVERKPPSRISAGS